MIKNILILFFCFFSYSLAAQQIPTFNSYMFNNFLLNPAAGATKNYVDLKLGNKRQWSAIEGSPQVYYLSCNMPIHWKENKRFLPRQYHGIGGYVNAEQAGIFQKITLFLSYSYHLSLGKINGEPVRASLGISAGVHNLSLNTSKIRLANPLDNAILGSTNAFAPDADLGIWIYHQKFYLGISAKHIASPKINFANENELVRHYFFTGGYRLQITSQEIDVIPSFLLKGTNFRDIQVNLSVLFRFKDQIWFGASYKLKESTAILLGFNMAQLAEITYAYESLQSGLQQVSTGSHEFMLAFKIGNYKHRKRSKPEIPLFE